MSFAERWMRRPQNVWLRRALFQVHLWTGIAVGLYVMAISISGSAIVFRNELYKKLSPGPQTFPPTGARLTHDALKRAAELAYAGYTVSYVFEGKRPEQSVEIWLRRGATQKQRLFNPYTGQDVGPAVPPGIKILAWLGDLHINLLTGKRGRAVNGIGAGILTVLCLTGFVIWWPGVESWRRSLSINWRANWKRLNWDIHSAVGIWVFLFVLMWGVTGVLLVFPLPYQNLVAHFTPINQPFRRGGPMAIGDQILRCRLGALRQPLGRGGGDTVGPCRVGPGSALRHWRDHVVEPRAVAGNEAGRRSPFSDQTSATGSRGAES